VSLRAAELQRRCVPLNCSDVSVCIGPCGLVAPLPLTLADDDHVKREAGKLAPGCTLWRRLNMLQLPDHPSGMVQACPQLLIQSRAPPPPSSHDPGMTGKIDPWPSPSRRTSDVGERREAPFYAAVSWYLQKRLPLDMILHYGVARSLHPFRGWKYNTASFHQSCLI
jgi:hypothetical protein